MYPSFILLVVLGEVSNFLAYSYAPAILVTPLGAVSVLVGYVELRLPLSYNISFLLILAPFSLLFSSMKSWEKTELLDVSCVSWDL